ncbi:MAG: zinc ribbon domain-containing protein [Oscillochloris sp.]|nr:zinc ribbon domain-containing protein [Oscillochloris sp.]
MLNAPMTTVGSVTSSRAMRASRTLMIAGTMLVLFFFSPFVSCGSQTYTGMRAFQESFPTAYIGPKDGIFLIILPIAGAIGAFLGYLASQRIAKGAALTGLRAFGVTTLVIALLTGCPIGVAFYDIQQSNGAWHLEWGYYGSLLAALALLWGGGELIGSTGRGAATKPTRICPHCGQANEVHFRFCMRCGGTIEPPAPGT